MVWRKRDGTLIEEVEEESDYLTPSISPDASRIAVTKADSISGDYDIWILPLDKSAPPFSYLRTPAGELHPQFSPGTQSGKWIDAPAIPDAYVVNGGQLLQRWTNDYFLATPHRAVNRSGGERYALAFFCDGNIDWPVAAVPTCVGPDKPPKYPTTYYTDYMIRYQQRTYNVFGTEQEAAK